MSDTTKKTPTKREVTVNGAKFSFAEAAASRGDSKGQPFLKLDPAEFDAPALLRLFTAAGVGPCIQGAVKWFNKTVADATAEAFTETTAADGTKSFAFDASVAAKGIVDAIAASVSAAKDELEAKLAELRAEQEKVMDPILITLQKGGQPSPADINRLTTLKVQIKQLELKLEKKVRKPKTVDAAKIVPGAPAK